MPCLGATNWTCTCHASAAGFCSCCACLQSAYAEPTCCTMHDKCLYSTTHPKICHVLPANARFDVVTSLCVPVQSQNYWYVTSWNSQKGKEFAKVGAFFKGFWIANVVEDAAYILQFLDSTATPLNGENLYNITFPGAAMPPTNGAFWSVQVMVSWEMCLHAVVASVCACEHGLMCLYEGVLSLWT